VTARIRDAALAQPNHEKNSMTNKSPAEAPLTVQDLEQSGYGTYLALDPDGWYVGMADELLKGATAAEAATDSVRARALGFLAAICSMVLEPDVKAAPLQPAVRFADGSSTLRPDGLAREQISLLAEFAEGVRHDLLRARLADLVWLKDRRRGNGFAYMAIDAYRARPIDPERWFLSDGTCWRRALQLAHFIRDEARIAEIESALLSAFRGAAMAPDREPLIYLAPLYVERSGVDAAEEVAAGLAALGRERQVASRFLDAHEMFDVAGLWFARAGREDQRVAMLAMAAGAMAARGDSDPAGIGKRHWYTKAIELFRKIPRAHREAHGVDAAVDSLRTKLAEAGLQAIGELSPIEQHIDLQDTAAIAVERVRGLAPLAALDAFCRLHKLPKRSKLFEVAEAVIAAGHVRHMFPTVVLDIDGRAIGQRPGISTGGEGRALHVNAEAVKNCFNLCGMTVTGMIEPALDAMQQEFNLAYADFLELARLVPLVPRDRAEVVAQGLHAGWCRDYVQAVHILLPQFEHMVRMTLKAAGAQTTMHDPEGLDTEVGLSNLIGRAEMIPQFGDDLTFTIRSLMCEQEGPNLRNAVAHGLAGRGLCEGPYGVYAWWLVLRLIVRQYVAMVSETVPPQPA
jgi:hypothetical protein